LTKNERREIIRRIPTYVSDHNPPTLQTDRQTTCDRKTALCTKVHRAVKTTSSQDLIAGSYNTVVLDVT